MSAVPPPPAAPSPRLRLEAVDCARGLALLAMFVFHFAYDLSYFGLIETDVPAEPGWRWFARLIAGSFLTLVGVSLVLATRNGLNRPAFLKRLAMVASAAALVTLATSFAMPRSFIFFGILHHVALGSVLALPFLRLPVVAVAGAAIIAFALPFLVAHPLLDEPWLAWLGFSRAPIVTADFVPVFPWFGCVLSGIVLARLALPRLAGSRLAAWHPASLPARILAWGGRHSLLVYLVHQPVFIGALMLALQLNPPQPMSEERGFMLSCQRSCGTGPLGVDACERLCTCTVDSLKRESLWRETLTDTLDPTQRERVSALAQPACARRHRAETIAHWRQAARRDSLRRHHEARATIMADHGIPHFHNDKGVAVIHVGAREFMCIGAKPPFDHPHVYLDMGADHEIVCPYCSTLYKFDASLKAGACSPPECAHHETAQAAA